MRKYIALLLTLALLLALTACGGGETPAGTTAPGQSADDPGKQTTESTESTETQPQELQDTPFGEYLSEEEILAMLESGDMTYWMSVDPALPEEPVDTGGDEPYAGFSNSIIFTDGGSAEGVEYPDFMSQLSPEMQAQWAEMEQELTDPEMMEMFEGMEDSDQP